MQRSFIRQQPDIPGAPGSGRYSLDDNSLDQLLKDCRSERAGDKLPNDKALAHLRAWHESGDVKELHHIIIGNIRLLVKCAHRYQGPDLPLWDLVAEAVDGFMDGLQRFDLSQAHKGPVANYAQIWARKLMLEYINDHGRTVRLSVRTMKAAKKGLKLLELEVSRLEHDRITLDHVMGERPPSERVGSLDFYGKNESLDDSRPMQAESHYEDIDGGYASPRRSSLVEKLSAPPSGSPAETPRGDEAANMIYLACRALPEDARLLVYAHYGIDGYDFAQECARLGLEHSDAAAIVTRSVAQLRSLAGTPPGGPRR